MVVTYRTIFPENIAQFVIFYRSLSDGLLNGGKNGGDQLLVSILQGAHFLGYLFRGSWLWSKLLICQQSKNP